MMIGAQTYIFSSITEEQAMTPMLEGLKHAGYDALETMYGLPPGDRAELDRLDLHAYALHIGLGVMPEKRELMRYLGTLGASTVCVSGLLDWFSRSPDDYRRSAQALNQWGSTLASEGIALHYHNHDFEFTPMQGSVPGMELLLQGLDPDCVMLCCDTGWIAYAGSDPVPFLKANAAQIGTVHLRDFRGRDSVHLGAGTIDLSAVLGVLPDLPNLKALMVEQDPTTGTPLEDMVASRTWLRERFNL